MTQKSGEVIEIPVTVQSLPGAWKNALRRRCDFDISIISLLMIPKYVIAVFQNFFFLCL